MRMDCTPVRTLRGVLRACNGSFGAIGSPATARNRFIGGRLSFGRVYRFSYRSFTLNTGIVLHR